MFKTKFVKIAGVAVILLLGVFLYSVLSPSENEETSFERTSFVSEEQTQSEAASLLRLLKNLENLALDPSLFASPGFVRLEDFTQPIPPQAPGRVNPFAPIDFSAGSR